MCRHRGARGRPGPCTTGLTAWHPVSKHSREVRTWSGEQAPPAALLGKRQGDSLVGSGNRTDRCPTQGEAGQAGGEGRGETGLPVEAAEAGRSLAQRAFCLYSKSREETAGVSGFYCFVGFEGGGVISFMK